MRKYHGEVLHAREDGALPIEVVQRGAIRSLHFGTPDKQSSMDLRAPHRLVLAYTRAMMAFLLFRNPPRSVLLIGLGGGSIARFLHHHYPECRIDVLEISAAVIEVAKRYFALAHDLRLHVGDAAQEIEAMPDAHYDAILLDAFDQWGISTSVIQDEFLGACKTRLAPKGVLVANVWGGNSRAFRTAVAAIEQAFAGDTLRVSVSGKSNVVLFGFQQPVSRATLKALPPVAARLQQQLGLEFPALLRKLQSNFGVFARWFGK